MGTRVHPTWPLGIQQKGLIAEKRPLPAQGPSRLGTVLIAAVHRTVLRYCFQARPPKPALQDLESRTHVFFLPESSTSRPSCTHT